MGHSIFADTEHNFNHNDNIKHEIINSDLEFQMDYHTALSIRTLLMKAHSQDIPLTITYLKQEIKGVKRHLKNGEISAGTKQGLIEYIDKLKGIKDELTIHRNNQLKEIERKLYPTELMPKEEKQEVTQQPKREIENKVFLIRDLHIVIKSNQNFALLIFKYMELYDSALTNPNAILKKFNELMKMKNPIKPNTFNKYFYNHKGNDFNAIFDNKSWSDLLGQLPELNNKT